MRNARILPMLRPIGGGMMFLASVAALGFGREPSGAVVPVVLAHKSAYVIYHDRVAPPSVAEAAVALRDHVARATGATLSIVTSAPAPGVPFIALGESRASRDAGLSIDAVAPDGFVIAARGQNVFILGPDSANGRRIETGGTSVGTANGVYAFLERYVDVRWLMPGEFGADIPERADLLVPAVDVHDGPAFASRRIPYIQNEKPAVAEWSRRQKLGYSLALYHGHNWEAIGPEVFDKHPDWFAARKGQRPKPGNRYKLETTNPALIDAFAAKAIDAFRKDPALRSYSLSPSDSADWSDSPESSALYDTDPHGALSVTPLILKFYNDVARVVGQEIPGRLLCGYIYAQYLYPPTGGIPSMEPNVCLVVAASIDYGYQWFRPAAQRELAGLMKQWGSTVPTTAYYDLPSQLEQTSSAPTPASPRILDFVFSNAAASGMKGVYIFGVADWGYGAATNYVKAKLAWNPRADASALVTEFFRRAYGPAAGAAMEGLNYRLETALEQFYLSHPRQTYRLTPEMLREVYAASFPDIERTYAQALERCPESVARRRLEMFGRNLIVLRWNLRREGLIPDTPSPLARSDTELLQLLREWDAKADLATAPETRAAVLSQLASSVR